MGATGRFIKEKILMLGSSEIEKALFKREALEFRALRESVRINTYLRIGIMLAFIFGLPLFKYVFKADLDFGTGEIMLVWMLLFTIFSVAMVNSGVFKNSKSLSRFYFWWLVFDFLWFAAIFYFVGGMFWLSIIIFTYYLTFAYFTFSAKQALFFVFEICFVFIAIALLEMRGVLPYKPFFQLGPELYKNIDFVVCTLISGVIIFYFAAQWNYTLSEKTKLIRLEAEKLRAESEALKVKTAQTEEAKDILRVRVKARTQELQDLAAGLEEKARERTRELQERVQELEKFRKLAVGRELRMMELKKTIQRLEQELKTAKKPGAKK